ncbi:acyltransferase [Roseomonas sp. NAR14]|uniref:Acyltransferase n=1 Tax=Roseomonas acroporae TaxID=2937791 RepID=A0A9X1Y988_9PROT|nr:acyltransferase [Roseomonas acroporae]MCK8784655.1 acyltransferase [Roseomonas acroporae]
MPKRNAFGLSWAMPRVLARIPVPGRRGRATQGQEEAGRYAAAGVASPGDSGALSHLDFLRFLAALGVVAEHYAQYLLQQAKHPEWMPRTEFLNLNVDLFFIISGFVIAYAYADRVGTLPQYGLFLRRRIARLAPLHWLTLGFYAFVAAAMVLLNMEFTYPGAHEPGCFVAQLLMVHAFGGCSTLSFNFPSWSISAEMFAYLLFPLLLRMGRRLTLALSIIAMGAMIAVSNGLPFAAEHPWYLWTSGAGPLRALVGFLFGLALFLVRHRLVGLPGARAGLLLAFAGFLGGGLAGLPVSWLMPCILMVAIFAAAADMQRRAGRRLAGQDLIARLGPLGDLTFSIYMLHMPVQLIVLKLLGQRLLHLDGLPLTVLAVTAVLVLVGLASLSLRYYETPLRALIGSPRRQPKPMARGPAAVA